jgi:hypothetical protein
MYHAYKIGFRLPAHIQEGAAIHKFPRRAIGTGRVETPGEADHLGNSLGKLSNRQVISTPRHPLKKTAEGSKSAEVWHIVPENSWQRCSAAAS